MFATVIVSFFFFNDTATTEIYTLSLHDALPIFAQRLPAGLDDVFRAPHGAPALRTAGGLDDDARLGRGAEVLDRKSTRLNSSHSQISYAVFCLKKKKKKHITHKRHTADTHDHQH